MPAIEDKATQRCDLSASWPTGAFAYGNAPFLWQNDSYATVAFAFTRSIALRIRFTFRNGIEI